MGLKSIDLPMLSPAHRADKLASANLSPSSQSHSTVRRRVRDVQPPRGSGCEHIFSMEAREAMRLNRRYGLAILFAALLWTSGAAGVSRAVDEESATEPDRSDDKEKGDKKKEGLPLKPTRKIEFTTDEATWLSLDVSPDGKTVVFELLGRLYTLPIDGGEAKPITSGLPFDSQPRYSPDGKMIAFISDRDGADNVWIAKADGAGPKQLSKDKQSIFASPAWTPDGQYVIVSRQTQLPWGAFELWMYHVKGGSGVQVTKAKAKPDAPPDQWFNAVGAVASPDGKYLYYTHRDKDFNPYNVT